MNALSPLGSYFQPPAASPQGLTQGFNDAAQKRAPSQFPAAQDGSNVALSAAGKALAQSATGNAPSLLQRASDLGSATIQAATSFIDNFAKALFGDAANGMSLSFDSSSISASSSFSSLVQHSEGSKGSSDSVALSLKDAADFTGKGTITTADGHSFSFEVQVHYESTLEMSASSTTTNASAPHGNHAAPAADAAHARHPHYPTGRHEGLAAHFPGSAAELFKMLNQGSLDLSLQGQANGSKDAASTLGSLQLNLLDLLPNPDPTGLKLAQAYGDFPASGKVAQQV